MSQANDEHADDHAALPHEAFRALYCPPELGYYYRANGIIAPARSAERDERSEQRRADWAAIEEILTSRDVITESCHVQPGEDHRLDDGEGQTLSLLARGEVQLARTAVGRVTPTVIRAGAGTILNPGVLARFLYDRGVALPAAAEAGRWNHVVVKPSIIVVLNLDAFWRRIGEQRDRVREALQNRLRSIYATHLHYEDLVGALRKIPALERLSHATLLRLLRSVSYTHSRDDLEARHARELEDAQAIAGDDAPDLGNPRVVSVLNARLRPEREKWSGLYITTRGTFDVCQQDAGHLGRIGQMQAFNTIDVEPDRRDTAAVDHWSRDQRALVLAPEGEVSFFHLQSYEIYRLLTQSESFRRRLLATTTPFSPTWQWGVVYDKTASEVVTFALGDDVTDSDAATAAAEHSLADTLAERLVTQHGDRVLRLHVEGERAEPAFSSESFGPNQSYDRLEVGTIEAVDVEPVDAVRQYMQYLLINGFHRYDYVLVTVGAELCRFREGLLTHADTLIARYRDPQRGRRQAAHQAAAAREVAFNGRRLHVRLAPERRRNRGAQNMPALASPVLWHRLRRVEGSDRFLLRDVQRLARALSGRLVGIAAGGGGALAYSCIEVFEALSRVDVPIDIVCGNSGGSVVGAYFCALERQPNGEHPGLERLRSSRLRRRLQFATSQAFLSSTAVSRFINRDLPGDDGQPMQVQDTPTRFLPFAVMADTLQPVVVEQATLGEGVAASGAAPMAFAPVVVGGSRFIDGAIVSNVPVDFLLDAGCGVVIAVDPLPSSPDPVGDTDDARAPWMRALRFFGSLPIGRNLYRFYDVMRSSERMISLSSEASSAAADLKLKMPYGSLLRMPLYLMVDDLLYRTRRQLDRTRLIPRARAMYEELSSHDERENVGDDWVTAAVLDRCHMVTLRHELDVERRPLGVDADPREWPA